MHNNNHRDNYRSSHRDTRQSLRGLYAITPLLPAGADAATESAWLRAIDAALLGGVRVLQFRDKSLDRQRCVRLGSLLRARCHVHGAAFIVNDDLALALQLAADGLHIGVADGEVSAVRNALPKGAVLGVSCYADLQRARRAVDAGADYVAFGAVAVSTTKPGAQTMPLPLALLGQARQTLQVPICAIGGITLPQAPALIAAGADLLAVIGDLFSATDIAAQARAYQSLFGATL